MQEKKKKEKIAISAVGSDLNSLVDSRFGRCSYFLLIDKEGELIESIPNQGQQARRGAGVAAAQTLVDAGVETVISGNIGPSAYSVLNPSGVKIFQVGYGVTADKAFEEYKKGNLEEMNSSSSHPGSIPPRGGSRRRFGGR